MLVVRVTVLTEKIPACVGTRPQVTRTTAKEAQNTGQCLRSLVLPQIRDGMTCSQCLVGVLERDYKESFKILRMIDVERIHLQGFDLPFSESFDRYEREERKRILQQEGIFSKSSILFTQLVVWLHPLCFQVDPCPVDAEEHGNDRRKVQVKERVA
jgi:hypothetical protein